ncbi:sialate O-acetylesterase [Flavobacteriaceae bacterium MAR_2009_75]|nr:sialate O-acetylesterase [Flavobacteriaceae bacterium MAR_2009_75]
MNRFYRLPVIIFVLCTLLAANAQVRLPKLISDGAVLQRDTELKIWGWASPNEAVELSFNQENYTTTADIDGNWHFMLPPQPAGGPYKMIVKGKNEVVVDDILFGEVWLCSGQSNMELTMHRLRDNYPDVIKNSKNSKIRQFLVHDKYDFNTVHKDLDSGSWVEANSQNLLNFSGVAYFFAKELYEKYRIPVGLINAALGGSPVESWMSEDALKEFPEAYAELQKFKSADRIAEIEQKDQKRQQDWFNELNEKDLGSVKGNEWFAQEFDDSEWKEMQVPSFWSDTELGHVNGVVWFRKDIKVPENWLGKETKLWLGRMVDQDHVYVNGTFVGTTGYQYPPRKYEVNDSLLQEGKNTITVRLISQQGKGGFISDKPYFIAVGKDTIDLKGRWKYKLGTAMQPLEGPTFIRWKPGGLYNRMISPLLNYKIKGAIWYQGESNTDRPETYNETFSALIKNWRDKWKIGEFPFLYVQLANYMKETHEPVESDWAKLRQAQLNTLKVNNTGMAVITDIGEWNDIHPLNKKDVGKRLAQLAYSLAYNESDTKLSPVPTKALFSDHLVQVSFGNNQSGLKSKNNGPLRTFELSSDGINFFKANAEIICKDVVVKSSKVSTPIAIRYAWSNNPAKANLFSKDGLPVSPFEFRKE